MRTLKPERILLIGGLGYIGCYLYKRLLETGAEIQVCDIGHRGNPLKISYRNLPYWAIPRSELLNYDVVLWFAGHSSVGQSVSDPQGALQNNCLRLFEFAQKLDKRTKFIYASSASLYSSQGKDPPVATEQALVNIPAQNPYDISKFAFDYIASNFLVNFYGLRMGTLSGWSPNLRSELVFNAMNISATRDSLVKLQNGSAWRSILFLEDLWILVKTLLQRDMEPCFINAASITLTMRQLAEAIADLWDADVQDQGEFLTYSFRLDCSLMRTICVEMLPERTVQSEGKKFIRHLRGEISS